MTHLRLLRRRPAGAHRKWHTARLSNPAYRTWWQAVQAQRWFQLRPKHERSRGGRVPQAKDLPFTRPSAAAFCSALAFAVFVKVPAGKIFFQPDIKDNK